MYGSRADGKATGNQRVSGEDKKTRTRSIIDRRDEAINRGIYADVDDPLCT